MKIIEEIDLINVSGAKSNPGIAKALREVRKAIKGIVWPTGSRQFTIHPESGKRSGEGNGVRPIRDAFVLNLQNLGWKPEEAFPILNPDSMAQFGGMDASRMIKGKPFLVEWETGNISSSHRAMNKMAVGLIQSVVVGGVLVVTSRPLAKFLTDRVGNIWELRPYFPLWSSINAPDGYLGIFVVEHDDTSSDVERIKKGTDGRALR